MKLFTRSFVPLLGVACVGWLVSSVAGVGDLVHSSLFRAGAALLLAIGLVASTRDIEFSEVRAHLRTVVVAVTIGVVLKAAIVMAVFFLFTGRPFALVLGIAVAQIDPLAVAAMGGGRPLSRRARTILSAWASFDDPVTVVLTIYLSGWVLSFTGGVSSYGSAGTQFVGFVADLGRNAAFLAVAWLLWKCLERLRGPDRGSRSRREAVADVIGIVLLVGLIAVATWWFLMLGLAMAALFFRPPLARALALTARIAFFVAGFGLGMLLVDGVSPWQGFVLGSAAVLAHALVSRLISRGLDNRDRAYLAAGQQNGVTAVILALFLERDFPGVVGIVAPAILVVGIVYEIWNGALLLRYRMVDRSLTSSQLRRAARARTAISSSGRDDRRLDAPTPIAPVDPRPSHPTPVRTARADRAHT